MTILMQNNTQNKNFQNHFNQEQRISAAKKKIPCLKEKDLATTIEKLKKLQIVHYFRPI